MRSEYHNENFPDLEVSWVLESPHILNNFEFFKVSNEANYAQVQ